MMKEFDIAVVGAGPGGYVAAIKAARAGAATCVIEDDKAGGTCLNRGCIPTKALFSTAHLLRRLRQAADHGIDIPSLNFDYTRAAERKDKVVAKLVGGVEQLLKGHGVDLFRGRGALEGPGRLRVRRGGVVGHVRAKKIILATGSLPAVPKSLPVDEENILTSTGILAIKNLPQSLLVVGGGYIGCEFASIFSTFGCRVTVVEALPRLLAMSDRQAVREVEKSFQKQGVKVHTGTSVTALETVDGGVRATLSSGDVLQVEKVLIAIGRRPNTEGLGLEEVGVACDERGCVQVDDQMRTSVDDVYAIGDVTGGIQLAHVASYQAGIAVTNALGGSAHADYRVVPSSIFTLPEVSQVGLSEEQCKEQGIEVAVGRFAYLATSKAVCEGETEGSIKLLAEKGSGRLLGASIAGADASTLIAEVGAAMAAGLTAEQLGEIIHSHPTLPEMVKEAAEDVSGLAVHKVGRRKR
ncbi:dihydrolipoyl dehydrogenase [Geothermobacter hydrogeniphilus]|uniref:Dihydrolipoyl dehydrogenase n=1 Tax=Geothermobacter hydrogeniphilus TaxID=1969733 RepID=A0A1X0YCU4_9BACT|nr:dihydrolipoyl dehydrogenase [Geothermobacter hydrogeniphilus]ORJ63040.1 dihydrolipoyl dehydrogenase [Geothermobacter hydrogeniphilus]